MHIANNIRKASFKLSLHQGSVFRLRGDVPFNSDDYHVFVVLNFDAQTGNVLFLINGTSQLEKRWRALEDIKKINANSTTVYIKAGSYSFLPKDTLFDCNSVHSIDINQLNYDNIRTIRDSLTKEDIDKLIHATLSSPLVERFIKNKINPTQK